MHRPCSCAEPPALGTYVRDAAGRCYLVCYFDCVADAPATFEVRPVGAAAEEAAAEAGDKRPRLLHTADRGGAWRPVDGDDALLQSRARTLPRRADRLLAQDARRAAASQPEPRTSKRPRCWWWPAAPTHADRARLAVARGAVAVAGRALRAALSMEGDDEEEEAAEEEEEEAGQAAAYAEAARPLCRTPEKRAAHDAELPALVRRALAGRYAAQRAAIRAEASRRAAEEEGAEPAARAPTPSRLARAALAAVAARGGTALDGALGRLEAALQRLEAAVVEAGGPPARSSAGGM